MDNFPAPTMTVLVYSGKGAYLKKSGVGKCHNTVLVIQHCKVCRKSSCRPDLLYAVENYSEVNEILHHSR
jgi:hypothetical protein